MVIRFSFFALIAVLLISSHTQLLFQQQLSQLEIIKTSGVLHVVTRIGHATYNKSADGYTGLEYDLVTRFADHLGVKVRFIVPKTYEDIFIRITDGSADIAAAGLTITEKRKHSVRFSPPYDTITEQLVYHSGKRKPKNIDDLRKGIIEVVKGSSHAETLMDLKASTPELEWYVNSNLDSNSLIYFVNEGLIDYTIADSNQIGLLSRFFPRLRVAFNISRPRSLGWVLAKTEDTSLYSEVENFFNLIKTNKALDQLIERYYAHIDNLDTVSLYKFRTHLHKRLPGYRKYFQQAALKYNIDWRLLAAIGYQESHWNHLAISPTGVRGIMMLTKSTAGEVGINDRIDPVQSIAGGALYFHQRINKIPIQVQEPDRTWMALASYNIGHGHLEDARKLTQQLGSNQDKWIDVKKHLPLLSEVKWYKQTRYGYARGHQPVNYVENIRNYYDLLLWMTEEDWIQKNAMSDNPEHADIILTENNISLL